MGDVEQWLRELGLGKYVQVFAENAIGADVLPHLSEEHLKEMGIALGDRVRLLTAIRAREAMSNGFPVEASTPAAADRAVARPDEAERRQLTVMFCDLVDSTALSRRLDPEDLREVNRAYQDAAKAAIEAHGGFVARYMGDGVLAYFGYPRAHEDDAEQAVRAGMAIVDEVATLDGDVGRAKGAALAVRVGIATGLVVVGDLIGEGASRESAVVGETPNLAAKLQTLAEPNSVLVAPTTRRLTAGHFEYRDKGEREVKGLPAPVQVTQVVRERRSASRFEAVRGRHLVPLVGREEETALLERRWERARSGEGQVVLVSGEPGIGKSRLTEELRARLEAEPHVRLRYQCSPHYSHSALHPIVVQLEHAAGITQRMDSEEKLQRLDALLNQSDEAPEGDIPLLAALLSIPTDGRYPEIEPDAKRLREQTLRALVRQLEGLCRGDPVLCIFEDVHWIDPTTRELLDRLVVRAESLPVLVIITFRPGFAPSWIGKSHVTLIALNRINQRLSEEMVRRLVGAKPMPSALLSEVVAKTDGVPLFVEELTRAVVQSELSADGADVDSPHGGWKPSIPATLQDSLMARLDQLSSGKLLAQIASAIGREFDYQILSAVCDDSTADLEAGLEELEDAGLIFRRDAGAGAVYTFKHALVQDAAYQSMLRGSKRELHQRVASAIEKHQPSVVESEPELLAHHFSEAGLAEPAIRYWHRAGQRASERSANLETIAHMTRALELVETLPESGDRAALELRLRITLGPALMNVEGSASREVAENYRRARDLSESVAEPEQRFVALWGLWINQQMAGEFEAAGRTAEAVIALASELSDSTYPLQAHHAAFTTAGYLGQHSKALGHLEKVLALYDMERHRRSAYIYGDHDAGVCGYAHKALIEWLVGHPDRAVADSRAALKLGKGVSHPLSLALAQCTGAMVRQLRGDAPAVARLATELAENTSKHGLAIWHTNAEILLGWASAMSGDSQGIEQMRRGLEERAVKGSKLRQVYYLSIFAELLGNAGKVDGGLDIIDQALLMLDESGEWRWESLVHKVYGDLLYAQKDPAQAESHLARARDIARGQEARSLELRAATSLARLWFDQGKSDEAKALLEPIYDSFEEGLETADLREANALLEQLS